MAAIPKPFIDIGLTTQQVLDGSNYTWRQVGLNSQRIDELDSLVDLNAANETLICAESEIDISTAGTKVAAYGTGIIVQNGSESVVAVGQDIDLDNADFSVAIGSNSTMTTVLDSVAVGANTSVDSSSGIVAVGRNVDVNTNSDNCVLIQGNSLGATSATTNSANSINIGGDGDINECDNSIQIGVNSDLIRTDRTIQIGTDSDVTDGDDNIIIGNGNDQTGARTIQIGHQLNTDTLATDYMCISQNPFSNPAPQTPAPGSVILGAGEDVSALPKLQFLATGMEGLKNDVGAGLAYTPYDGVTPIAVPTNGGWLRCKIGTHTVRLMVFPDTDTANAP